jgi:hypothetical protein
MMQGLVRYKGVEFYLRDLYHINGEWIAVTDTGEEIIIDDFKNIKTIKTDNEDVYEEKDQEKHDIYE